MPIFYIEAAGSKYQRQHKKANHVCMFLNNIVYAAMGAEGPCMVCLLLRLQFQRITIGKILEPGFLSSIVGSSFFDRGVWAC